MSFDGETGRLVVGLHDPAERAVVATELARRLGVDEFLLFVRDPELGVLIPAPGFAQTLRGGPSWRGLLRRCDEPGRHAAEVDLPRSSVRPALALAYASMTAILIGGSPVLERVAVLDLLMPLLAATFVAEHRVVAAAAEASEARGAAEQARALARALDDARAEGVRLNERLREEHRQKDDFLAMLGHELRNPLTPLVTSIELLQLGRLDAAAITRQLAVMSRQVGQLSRLVEDLLDVSRVSRGRIELRREPTELMLLVQDALEASRPLLEARQHDVRLHGEAADVVVDVDAVRIRQVLANLLHNAGKYTDLGGRIDVRVRVEGEEAIVEVEDNGFGIAPHMQPRVFDLFVQAPVSLERAQGGLGIGLTLVRSLVELHGGKVTVSSAGVGSGSRFTVRLPVANARAVPAPAVPRIAESPGGGARALRVLVVDDNQDAANALGIILELLGHRVQLAYSGATALQLAADLNPDLVLLDIGLPEMDGYEVARRLRRITRRGAVFVALTGYGTDDDRRRAREAGFDEHKVKPVSLDAVRALTERVERGVALTPLH